MADDKKQLNWLEKHRAAPRKDAPPDAEVIELHRPPVSDGEAQEEGYRPFYKPHAPQVRLRFMLQGGETVTIPYSQILMTQFRPPDSLAVHTASHLFLIEGRELARLDELLADEQCALIVQHDETHDGPPPQSGPLIENIKIIGPDELDEEEAA